MRTLEELIKEAHGTLPPCDDYAKDEIRIISVILEAGAKTYPVAYTFIITFHKAGMEGIMAWELKDIETRRDHKAPHKKTAE